MCRIIIAIIASLWPVAALALSGSGIPTKVPITWGSSAPGGNITCPMPNTSQIATNPGRASWPDGFPPATFQSIGSGGVPPDGRDFNGVLCQLSKWTNWQNAGGPVYYDAAFSGVVGGYPKGASLANLTTPGCFWVSSVDNNTTNPDTGGANWVNTCTNIFSSIGANTWIGNATNGSAAAVANAWPACPDSNGQHLNYASGAGVVCGTSVPIGPPVLVVSGPPTITPALCGSEVWLTGSGFYSVTTFSGTFPNGCQIKLLNTTALAGGRGRGINAPGVTAFDLYPQQEAELNYNTAIGGFMMPPITPWPGPASGIVFFKNQTLGSNNPLLSDGLASGSGAFQTMQYAEQQVYFANTQQNAVIQADCETTYTNDVVDVFGKVPGRGDALIILGNPASPGSCITIDNLAGQFFDVEDGGGLVVNGFEVGASANTNIFYSRQLAALDFLNIIFASNTSGTNLFVDQLGSANITGTYTIAGSAAAHINVRAGRLETGGITVINVGTNNVGTFYTAIQGGTIAHDGGALNFSGNPAQLGGRQVTVSSCGVITQNGTSFAGTGLVGTTGPGTDAFGNKCGYFGN